jgi:hypothetical protein
MFRASLNSWDRGVHRRDGIGGGGSLDRLTLFALLPLVVIGMRKLGSRRT